MTYRSELNCAVGWDKVIVLQVPYKSQVSAVKPRIMSQVNANKSCFKYKSQVRANESLAKTCKSHTECQVKVLSQSELCVFKS